MLKRAIDILGAGMGLVLFSPFLIIIAIAIKLSSPGPVFFRQERLGLDGSTFRIFKFRTMTTSRCPEGCLVTASDDNRITRFGAFLRRHKLDELPQLFNVVLGDMALVGPRPEVQEFAAVFPKEYEEILTVKPGITHRATLLFRNEEEMLAGQDDPVGVYLASVMPMKLKVYRAHLEQSIFEDLKIIALTVFPSLRAVRGLTGYDLGPEEIAALAPGVRPNQRAMKEMA